MATTAVELTALDAARAAQDLMRTAEIGLAVAVVEWAVAHPPLDEADIALVRITQSLTSGVELPLNGEGVPVVSAVGIAELGTTLGLTTEAGRRLVSECLELAFRLPRLWEAVRSGGVPVWMARRIADQTNSLPSAGAEFVDRQLAVVAGRVGMAQVQRLVEEALIRFDPQAYREQLSARGERRHFDVELDRLTLSGTVPVGGVMELPDALALNAAVSHGAQQLAAWGSTDSLGARRARAAGDLGREHLELFGQDTPGSLVTIDERGRLVLDEDGHPVSSDPDAGAGADGSDRPGGFAGVAAGDAAPGAGAGRGAGASGAGAGPGMGVAVGLRSGHPESRPVGPPVPARREIVLHVHLTDHALTATTPDHPAAPQHHRNNGDAQSADTVHLARIEGHPAPVRVEAVRRWCAPIDTSLGRGCGDGTENRGGTGNGGGGGVKITVRPVLDLAEHLHHSAYEIPTRLREQIIARDITCVYPRCTRPARSGDIDHIVPFDHDHPTLGGQTETSNLAALCRHHHRLKTTGHLTYEMTRPGVFAWTLRDGSQHRRDHTGTTAIPTEPEPEPPTPIPRH